MRARRKNAVRSAASEGAAVSESSGGHRGRSSATRALLALLAVSVPGKTTLVLGLMLLRSVTSSFGLLMLVPMLGVVGLDVQEGSIGSVTRFVERGFAFFGVEPSLMVVLAVYVGVMTANALLVRWQAVASVALEQEAVAMLRKRLYRSIAGSKWLYFARQRATDITHLLTIELERVGAAVSALLALAVKLVLGAIYFALALVLSPAMTGIVTVAGLVLAGLLSGRTVSGHRKGVAISEAFGGLYRSIGEQMAGMKVLRSLGAMEQQVTLFDRQADQTAVARLDLERNSASLGFWFEVGSVVILAGMLVVALELLALPLPTILLLLFLFARVIPMATGIQRGVQQYLNLAPAHENVMRALERYEAASEAGNPMARPFRLSRAIELKDVSFRYRWDEQDVLRHVDVAIAAGQTTALVGPSGAGKSTLADLAIGLMTPDRGCILIDDELLSSERLIAWRQQVGYVPQDVFLFHESIQANLLLVDPTASEARLWEALGQAAAADFVADLPDGLATIVGDRGIRLSGGERQRLALARALLRRPRLLVLDEATSALDAENERRIQAAIEGLHGQMTILVIAHRLSTIRKADAIHVVERGQVVESGRWEDLVADPGGRFSALYRAQAFASP